MFDLKDKVIFVTGGGSGIGRATVELCRSLGAKVIAADLAEAAETHAALGLSDDDLAVQLDVSDEAAVEASMQAVSEKYGRLDGLVNSAGITGQGPIDMVPRALWDKVMDVQLTGTFLVCQKAMALFKAQQSGAIVNLASIYGLVGGTGGIPYNTAKAGVAHMTKCMAADHGRENIRVNAVAPGYIDTPMTVFLNDDSVAAFRDKFVAAHPLKRAGTPEEVAQAIVFLLSDAAAFISGTVLPVDGGFSQIKEIV